MESQGTAAENVERVPDSKVRSNRIWLYLKKFCLDMLPVIAGVVIGMFVNSYTEEQKNQSLLENTLQALSHEFTENGKQISNKLPRHDRIIDSLNYYTDNEEYTSYEILSKAGGLSTGRISTTNWRAALNNYSLQLINFPTIKLLSRIESLHEEQARLGDWFEKNVYSTAIHKRGEEGVTNRMNVLGVMSNFKDNEIELLQLYDDFAGIVSTKKYHRQ